MGENSLPGLLTKSDITQVKWRDVAEENEVWVQYEQSRCTGDNKKKGK
jgi:hypothetical protein